MEIETGREAENEIGSLGAKNAIEVETKLVAASGGGGVGPKARCRQNSPEGLDNVASPARE